VWASMALCMRRRRLGLRVGLGAVGEGRMRFLGRLSSGSGSSAAGRRAFRVVMGCVLGRAGGGRGGAALGYWMKHQEFRTCHVHGVKALCMLASVWL
jgi:hypothetical protein